MSNTGRNKKLASFNCDQELWAGFMRRCQEKGTTATATLTQFIKLYLDGSLDNLDDYLGNALDSRLEERVRASVDEYLVERLPLHLDNYLANYQGNWKELQNTVVALSEKVESLKGSLTTSKIRTHTNKTNSTPEREEWFIQQRAKHLGVKLNADQVLRVEMFADDAYKERHGLPPSKKLFKTTQSSVYPAADVDILDSLIRGVVARG